MELNENIVQFIVNRSGSDISIFPVLVNYCQMTNQWCYSDYTNQYYYLIIHVHCNTEL